MRGEHARYGTRGLREDYPAATTVLLYRGDERLLKDGIHCLTTRRPPESAR